MQVAIELDDCFASGQKRTKWIKSKKKTKDIWICITDSVQEPPPIQTGNDIIEKVNWTLKCLWNEILSNIFLIALERSVKMIVQILW